MLLLISTKLAGQPRRGWKTSETDVAVAVLHIRTHSFDCHAPHGREYDRAETG